MPSRNEIVRRARCWVASIIRGDEHAVRGVRPHLHEILHQRLRCALDSAVRKLVREGLSWRLLGEDGIR